MYQPPHFAVTDNAKLHALMRARPLAALVVHGSRGLNANHVPLVLDAHRGTSGTLRGHIARANPLVVELASERDALAIFHGPDAYVSPSYYVTKAETGRVVPTWNYVAVHANGTLRLVEDEAWLRALLEDLTAHHERRFEEPWKVSDAPRDYVEGLMNAIVGIEMDISRVEGKWKLSQNQPARNVTGVCDGLIGQGNAEMAALISLLAAEINTGR